MTADDQTNLAGAARQLAAQRSRMVILCAECGAEIVATSRRRYCSNTCNVRAWRRTHPAVARTPLANERAPEHPQPTYGPARPGDPQCSPLGPTREVRGPCGSLRRCKGVADYPPGVGAGMFAVVDEDLAIDDGVVHAAGVLEDAREA